MLTKTAKNRVSFLEEDETDEENRILESVLPGSDSTDITYSHPESVEYEFHCDTQDNIAYGPTMSCSKSRRQCQATRPQELEEDTSSEMNRGVGQESVALELQQNIAYSTVTTGQSEATQLPQEITPESLQTSIAYNSTLWRQGEDMQLQETEEEYSYVTIN